MSETRKVKRITKITISRPSHEFYVVSYYRRFPTRYASRFTGIEELAMPKWFSLSLLVADRHARQFIEFLASGTPSEAIA